MIEAKGTSSDPVSGQIESAGTDDICLGAGLVEASTTLKGGRRATARPWFEAAVVRARAFLGDRAGNVALMTAICAIPLFGMMGLAIDYSIALSAKAKLDSAADAAAVAAVTMAQTVIQGGGTIASAQSAGRTQGAKVFAANAGSIGFGQVPVPTVTMPLPTGKTLTATVSYQSSTTANFGKLFGISQMSLGGNAASTLTMMTYINYYIIVDISQSMGIGTTATDMQNLFNRTTTYNGSGCVFGCHVPETGQAQSNEALAHNISPKITLRIDSAVTAIQNVIAQAQANAGSNGNIKIGLYTMNQDPTTGSVLTTIAAPTNQYNTLTTAASSIDLGNNTSNGIGDSDFTDSLTTFNALLPANGTGASASSPLNYVFLITDGVQDVYGSGCQSGHCVAALSSSLCTPLQQKATVGVIYTPYLPIYNNNNSANGWQINYQQLVLPIVGNITPNLSACASAAQYYLTATDGGDINTQMSKLFASTSQLARLVQ